ncbi:MAG: HDIG domain-containing protein [Clostridia bacterium]|nr:HDIG domain-containing protein [Clostridia bacterium]
MRAIDKNSKLKGKELFKIAVVFLLNTCVVMGLMLVFLLVKCGGIMQTVEYVQSSTKLVLFILFSVMVLGVVSYLYFLSQNKEVFRKPKKITMIYSAVILSMIASYLFGMINVYLRPISLCALFILILVDKRTAVFMNCVFALLMMLTDLLCVSFAGNGNYVLVSLILCFATGMFSVFLVDGEGSRGKVLVMGFVISLPVIISAGVMEFTLLQLNKVLFPVLYALGSGLLATCLMTVILPLFEVTFGALTNFRLTELTDHKSRLIKELSISAPGTFSHTIIVAMLAEACGNAIGENPLLVRACAYYHDMGKLKNPEMFTENQTGKNPHDALSPELSTDIIRSHARDGADLIRKRRLPEAFAEAAEQHHGTLPIRYFYMKASKFTDGKLALDNFSYYGPKPQNKINAIIMICDACEAKVRAVSNRTHENVDKAVKEIIEERMDMDQFNECDITFQELGVIRNTITNTLSGVYHDRVKYPKLKSGGRR